MPTIRAAAVEELYADGEGKNVCGDETEPDGVICTGTLTFGPDDPQARCSACGGWTGRYAPTRRLPGLALVPREDA